MGIDDDLKMEMSFKLMELSSYDCYGSWYLPPDALVSLVKHYFDPFYIKLYDIDLDRLNNEFRAMVEESYRYGIINRGHIHIYNQYVRKIQEKNE